MKPTVKSSLPTAAIVFMAVMFFAWLAQLWLEDYKSSLVTYRPSAWLAESVFTSDGSLVHYVYHEFPRNHERDNYQAYDENLSVKNPPMSSKAFQKYFYREGCVSIEPSAGEKKLDWLSRAVIWVSPVWWNGPEGQFDRYDLETRLRVESIGPDGTVARAPARPQGRFRLTEDPREESGNGNLLITGDGVLRLNADSQRLSFERLFDGKVDGRQWRNAADGKTSGLFLISKGALWQLDLQSPPVRKIPLSDELIKTILSSSNRFMPLENGGYSLQIQDHKTRDKETLLLLGSDGRILRRVEIDRAALNVRLGGEVRKSPSITMPIVTVPLRPYWIKLSSAAIIQYAVLSLMLAGLVAWHQARTGRRGWRAFGWAAFTFLTGLTGAVCYVIAHWDKRTELCPGCGKRRPIALDTCPHCNIPWLTPAKSGFEVLETP